MPDAQKLEGRGRIDQRFSFARAAKAYDRGLQTALRSEGLARRQREGHRKMHIDHIGIVVRNIEQGIARWQRAFGYEQQTEIVVNTRQQVKVVFLEKADAVTVKLIQPVDASSPAMATLKGGGGGLDHLCFRCGELKSEIARLEELGMRVLVPPQPGEAFESEDIAFVFAGDGLKIELIATDKRAARRPR